MEEEGSDDDALRIMSSTRTLRLSTLKTIIILPYHSDLSTSCLPALTTFVIFPTGQPTLLQMRRHGRFPKGGRREESRQDI